MDEVKKSTKPHHTKKQRLARQIQKEQGVRYTEALRIADEEIAKDFKKNLD